MDKSYGFEGVLYAVPSEIRRILSFIPEEIKSRVEEIRLRSERPLSLTVRGESLFVLKSGEISRVISRDLLFAQKEDLAESFRLLCNSSVYAHTAELRDGYIIMRGGHRAGVCGRIGENGIMQDISSLNIRIAREVKGCAGSILEHYDGGGLLIAGPPGSGKTTVLRDMLRQLSDGFKGEYKRIVVIDSRGELSGSYGGICSNDLGNNTDVLMMKNKALGTEIALRTMFPDIIAFDEIGTAAELKGVSESFNAGVDIITTAHANDISDILRRSVTKGLINSGAVSRVVMLSKEKGSGYRFFEAKRLGCNADT